jgi:hypothetical protein
VGTLTVRLPEALVTEIEAEARRRALSKSEIVRLRLARPRRAQSPEERLAPIAELVGSVDGLPGDSV